MKYRWIEPADMTADGLEQLLGIKVLSITKGDILIDEVTEPWGGITPIVRRGIEIEFETTPNVEMLEQLDRIYNSLQRDGKAGTSAEIDDLKRRIEALERLKS